MPRRGNVAVAVWLLALWTCVTAVNVPHWQTSITLWRHAVSITPQKPRPVVNLGVSLIAPPTMDEAERLLEVAEVLAVQPTRGWRERETSLKTARLNLALIVLLHGHPDQARRLLTQVREVDPENPVAAKTWDLLERMGS